MNTHDDYLREDAGSLPAELQESRGEVSRLTAKLAQSKADKASAEKLLAIALDAAEAKAAELAATKAELEQARLALRDLNKKSDFWGSWGMFDGGIGQRMIGELREIAERGLGGDNA